MASALDHLPKGQEFSKFYCSVLVHVDLIEELSGGNLGKASLPVLQSLSFVNLLAAINIENCKNFVDLCFERG